MKCQICEKNDAVLHIEEIVDGKREEMHVCKECAERKGILDDIAALDFSLESVMKDTEKKVDKKKEKREKVPLKCSVCDYDFNHLSDMHMLGCPHCYLEFRDFLKPIFEGFQADSIHEGRVPGENRKVKENMKKLEALNNRLEKVLKAEDYETAVSIRDQIMRLKKNTYGNG